MLLINGETYKNGKAAARLYKEIYLDRQTADAKMFARYFCEETRKGRKIQKRALSEGHAGRRVTW